MLDWDQKEKLLKTVSEALEDAGMNAAVESTGGGFNYVYVSLGDDRMALWGTDDWESKGAKWWAGVYNDEGDQIAPANPTRCQVAMFLFVAETYNRNGAATYTAKASVAM